jgi:hypothetical protein
LGEVVPTLALRLLLLVSLLGLLLNLRNFVVESLVDDIGAPDSVEFVVVTLYYQSISDSEVVNTIIVSNYYQSIYLASMSERCTSIISDGA